jgi:flagellar FliL protein
MSLFSKGGGLFRRKRGGAPSAERAPWLAPTVLLTLVSIGAGIGLGNHLVRTLQAADKAKPAHTQPASETERSRLKYLKPIVTNIAEPSTTWARLEAAIVFQEDMPNADALVARIGEDLLGYMRTLKLAQFEGAGQFQHLREDLKDRVAIRTGGEVRDFIIESLVIQ